VPVDCHAAVHLSADHHLVAVLAPCDHDECPPTRCLRANKNKKQSMHYKNGREAKNGDMIVTIQPGYGWPVAGVLYGAKAEHGNDCNGRIAVPQPGDTCADLKNCLHIDDVIAAAGSDSIPDTSAPVKME
jgi:hypothetical protein